MSKKGNEIDKKHEKKKSKQKLEDIHISKKHNIINEGIEQLDFHFFKSLMESKRNSFSSHINNQHKTATGSNAKGSYSISSHYIMFPKDSIYIDSNEIQTKNGNFNLYDLRTSQLSIGMKIGEGTSGIVCEGILAIANNKEKIKIAIKYFTCIQSSKDRRKKLINEVLTFSQIKDPDNLIIKCF